MGTREERKIMSGIEVELMRVRLRHAALGALQVHLKNYLDCMELEYYGPRSDQEKLMCDDLRASMKRVGSVLSGYYDREVDLLG